MNIHPLLVHFPIGILTLYVFFEVARVRFITKQSFYVDVKTVLVTFGVLAGYLATATGDMAEELAGLGQNSVVGADAMPLIETHAFFAISTITIFSILAGSYVFQWCTQRSLLPFITKISFLQKVSSLIQKSSFILAIVGMIVMTITGGLGASLVYGANFDPIVQIIYGIFAP